MKKKHDCPEVHAGMNYIEINTSKYKIEKKIFKGKILLDDTDIKRLWRGSRTY